MTSIWKELLFLQGHFVRPEDVLDEAVVAAARAAATRESRASREPGVGTDALACGGCN